MPKNPGLEMQFPVDLSNVDFVDEGGSALLRRMVSQGAKFVADGNLMMSLLVDEIWAQTMTLAQ